MTINKATTSSKTKKKSESSQQVASSSSTKFSKTINSSNSKEEIVKNVAGLSKCSSSSSLQIADVSDLPVDGTPVKYTVTESLPTGSVKITTYAESGATSTEYRHSIAQDVSSSKHTSDITQISSTLNQSLTNLTNITSSDDNSLNTTYTVIEPKEDKISKVSNLSNQLNTVADVQVISSSSVQQTSSSTQKSSSNSYLIEVVDGKERIIDQKRNESEFSKMKHKEKHNLSKSGTGTTSEFHSVEKGSESTSAFDTSNPQLKEPKTDSTTYVREFHEVGGVKTSKSCLTDESNYLEDKQSAAITRNDSARNSLRKADTNWDGTFVTEKVTGKQTSSDSRNFSSHDTSSNIVESSSESTTKKSADDRITIVTTTYYDSSGNVIKVDTQQEKGQPDTVIRTVDAVDSSNKRIKSSEISDTTDFISSSDINVDKTVKRDSTKQKFDVNGTSKDIKTESQTLIDKEINNESNQTDTRWVDENYVDTSKIRNAQYSTDTRNFYPHGIDSTSTVVKNTYDTKAVQNVIGTKGKVLKPETTEPDVVYSNDRNYGKTGWNGKFIYETPQKPKQTGPAKTPETSKAPTAKNKDQKVKPDDQPKSTTKYPQPDSTGSQIFIDKEKVDVKIKSSKSPDRPSKPTEDFSKSDSKTIVDYKTFVENIEDVSKTSDYKTIILDESRTVVKQQLYDEDVTSLKDNVTTLKTDFTTDKFTTKHVTDKQDVSHSISETVTSDFKQVIGDDVTKHEVVIRNGPKGPSYLGSPVKDFTDKQDEVFTDKREEVINTTTNVDYVLNTSDTLNTSETVKISVSKNLSTEKFVDETSTVDQNIITNKNVEKFDVKRTDVEKVNNVFVDETIVDIKNIVSLILLKVISFR